jgi:glycosyltransferase involved in cell wall biosynthesis
LALQDRVEIQGHVSDVRPYYRQADVVVISSTSEGSPNVLFEAMAAGVPVVATRVGGIPEIVKDGDTAILVEPSNPVALGRAIERVLVDPELASRVATRARALVQERYSPANRTRVLTDLYVQLLQEWHQGGGNDRLQAGKGVCSQISAGS